MQFVRIKLIWGGVILLSLFSTFLPYKYVKIPLLGVLVGSTKFACFPLLQYSMFFLFGIFFCKQGMKMTNKILLLSFMLTGTSFAYIIFHHSIPNRFPPTCFWILLPCASLAVYWKFLSIVKNLSFFNRHKKQIGIYGSNMLDYLVLSNVLIFLARFIYGHNLNVSLCLMMIVFILVTESTLESGIFEIPFDYHVHLGWFAAKDSSRENICKNHL